MLMAKLGDTGSKLAEGNLLQFPEGGPTRRPDKIAPRTIDLGTILITLIKRCRSQMAPDLTIRLSATPGAGASIAWEEAATLDFVISEIISNAYRYSHPGGSPVEITIECGVNRDGEIVIDIGDNGVGLPPDFAEWRDAGNGMVSVRYRLQQIGAQLNVTSDDLGLRFLIILHSRQPRATPARGNFVWL
ncbi:MAG TPA: ATP-binding protein [Rhizomicrobium sp.]|jgi:two-component sensor histidine kinase|nr:ATP-binding protein [Rhizomicrobium sp.]